MSTTREGLALVPTALPFGQACKHLRLVVGDDVSERSHVLTIPSTLAPICPMLAEASLPRGSDTGLTAAGYVVSGLSTARCLAAVPPRVLVVEHQAPYVLPRGAIPQAILHVAHTSPTRMAAVFTEPM